MILCISCRKEEVSDFGPRTYYWGDVDKKVPVKFTYKVWAVKPQAGVNEVTAATLGIDPKQIEAIVRISEKITRVEFTKAIREPAFNPEVIQFGIPALLLDQSVNPILMTGSVSLMPDKDTDIEAICKKYDLILKSKLSYGVYYLEVKDAINTLKTANKIHENESVQWCVPEFHALYHTM